MGACFPVLTNLNLGAWAKLAVTPEDEWVVSRPLLTYGFPAWYQGLVPSLSSSSHASAKADPRDIAFYITMELDHWAMQSPFDQPSFTPWRQVNPFLSHPKNDSHNGR